MTQKMHRYKVEKISFGWLLTVGFAAMMVLTFYVILMSPLKFHDQYHYLVAGYVVTSIMMLIGGIKLITVDKKYGIVEHLK